MFKIFNVLITNFFLHIKDITKSLNKELPICDSVVDMVEFYAFLKSFGNICRIIISSLFDSFSFSWNYWNYDIRVTW